MRRIAIVLISLIVLVISVVIAIIVFAPVTAPAFRPEAVQWAAQYDWAPDGGITKMGDQWFFSSGREGISHNVLTGQSNVIIGPSGVEEAFDRDYAAPGSVIEVEGVKYMFYHAERHECENAFPFRAAVGLATSQDGVNWDRQGQVLASWETNPLCTQINAEGLEEPSFRPQGVGYPSAVVKDGYAYLFFVGWYPNSADGIYAARCPISEINNLSCWMNYSEGNWDQPGIGGQSTQVLGRSNEAELYLAAPQVQLVGDDIVGVFETDLGFVTSTTRNGFEWTELVEIFTFPQSHIRSEGANWYSYPSLVNDEGKWWLYFAQQSTDGIHRMQRLEINFPYAS